jgi:hypothetical protein
MGQRAREMDVGTKSIPTTARSSTASNMAKTRDGDRYVLTKEVVAKVPYCLGKNMSCGRCRKCSGARKTEKLKDVIYGPPEFIQPGNKTLVNNLGSLVTLSKQAHVGMLEVSL